jgi:Peptidase A4 family
MTDEGGELDHYLIDDEQMDVALPPPTFVPSLANNSELALYGLPAKPTDPDVLAAWTNLVTAWRRTPDLGLCVGPPGLRFSTHVTGNWAGMVASAGSTTWNTVAGTFKQPTFNSAGCSQSSEADWVGLGGYGSDDLTQDGTYMEQGPKYWAFYEYIDVAHVNPPITLPNITVKPGNSMYAYVFFQASTSKVEFFVEDETTGTTDTVWLSNASSYYDGHAVDFIDEKPWTSLPDFNTIPWSGTGEGEIDGSWHNLGTQNPISQIMERGGTVLAEPAGMTSSTSFSDYWNHC